MENKKIYTNTIAQIGGKVVTALISIFLIKIISNYLDIAGYGLYSKLYNYLSIFAVLADFGLYTISVREMSKNIDNPTEIEKISGNILSLRTISGFLIIFLSLFIAIFLDGYNSNFELLWVFIVGIFTLFGLINSSIMSYLQAILKTEFSFIANTSGKILTFLLIIATVYWFFPKTENFDPNLALIFILISGLLGNILMTFLTFNYARKFQKIKFYFDKDYIKKILKLSIPYGIALFLGAIFFKIDTLFLSILEKENTDTIIWIYSLPMKIVEVWMMYGTIFLNSFLPILTIAITKNNKTEIQKLSEKWFEILFGFGVAISVFLAFFATKIIPFISNSNFAEAKIGGFGAIEVMQIVAWIFLFYFVSSLANYILIAKNEQKKIIFVNLAISIFNIIWNLILIPKYSFIGAAIITVISQIILVIISIFLVKKELKFSKILIKWWFLTIFAFLGGIVALFLEKFLDIQNLFLSLGISGSIFGIIFLWLWFLMKKFLIKFAK